MSKGVLFIISAASGTGKDTIISRVVSSPEIKAKISVSMTTRKPRKGETEGVDYFFVNKSDFENSIQNNEMLEYAKYGSSYYGTPRRQVEEWLESGYSVFLSIEVQGASLVKENLPESRSIFIVPPSMAELERRLRLRGTETDEAICARLDIARHEIRKAENYDYIVFNDNLEEAVNDVIAICRAEVNLANGTDDEIKSEKAEQLKSCNMRYKLKEVELND